MPVSVKVAAGLRADGKRVKKLAEAILEDLGLDDSELSVLLTDNAGIRELNRKYRRMDRPTDVLSFPMDDTEMLGDVIISVEKARTQAKEFGTGFNGEMARLLIHGILHLVGHDHVRGGRQAARMREKEEELLQLSTGLWPDL
ncbi:MAG: rRNA maturation RNase YbeY [Deltaproteobacteria bacterium]|nr:rRNA maturation RNase YbeY [Deltaproteobacteria bacterium]